MFSYVGGITMTLSTRYGYCNYLFRNLLLNRLDSTSRLSTLQEPLQNSQILQRLLRSQPRIRHALRHRLSKSPRLPLDPRVPPELLPLLDAALGHDDIDGGHLHGAVCRHDLQVQTALVLGGEGDDEGAGAAGLRGDDAVDGVDGGEVRLDEGGAGR